MLDYEELLAIASKKKKRARSQEGGGGGGGGGILSKPNKKVRASESSRGRRDCRFWIKTF